jgi:Interleukin-like EMT inducer
LCCAECLVEALSWGNGDTTIANGYIAINGNRVTKTDRGFNLMQLNAMSCSTSNYLNYDTWASTTDSDNMATYITSLPLNTVLIGVTADEAAQSLTQNAKNALLALGVDGNALQPWGKLSFVAQIGQPATAVSQVAPPGGINSKTLVNITGIFPNRSQTEN